MGEQCGEAKALSHKQKKASVWYAQNFHYMFSNKHCDFARYIINTSWRTGTFEREMFIWKLNMLWTSAEAPK